MKEKEYGCEVCRYHELETGDTLYHYSSWDGGIGFDYIHNIRYCPVCGKELPKEDDAVHVTKHGRPIDADALITTFCEWGTRLERGGRSVITMAEAKQAIVDIIESAPTIIPAEEKKV